MAYDYNGDFREFQEELDAAHVSKEQFDITNYCGLTYQELKSTVRWAIRRYGTKVEVR